MNIHERRDAIIEILNARDYISVDELASTLGVSCVTIRSDLDALAQKGVLKRLHGGAALTEKKSLSRLISNTISEFRQEKERIGRAAASLVQDNQTVIVDSGSTTVHVPKHLSGKGITMVTSSLIAIDEVSDDESIEVMVLGGMLRRYSLGVIGSFACRELAELHADILFLGASGYTDSCLYCSNVIEAETKRAMIKAAGKVCFLADSTKNGKKAFANVCSWDDIDVFITDDISDDLRRTLESKGIEIIIAE